MKKALTDDAFFDELTHLFLTEGIKSLTMGEMAARLRCSRRRLYDIAQTKEEIFCATVDRFFRSVLDKGEMAVRDEKDLTVALAAYLDVGVQASGRIGVPFLKDLEDSEAGRALFDGYQQARTVRLSQLIDEGVHQGVFVACHGRMVSEMILGAALRLRRPAFLAQAGLSLEEAFQELYRILLGGLLADASARKSVQAKAPAGAAIAGKAQPARAAEPPDAGDDVSRLLIAAWNRS